MALREKWVPIAFSKGIDTETNEKTVVPGTLTDCENGTFQERITVVKRPGTRTLGRRIGTATGYSQLSGALGLASRADGGLGSQDDAGDLVLVSPTDELYSYDDSSDQWIRRGDWPVVSLELEHPPRGPNEGWDATACSSGAIQLWAWEDVRGGVFARTRNVRTGVTYGPEFRVGGTTGRSPVALTVGSSFHVYFVSGTANTLNVAVLNAGNPTSTSASFVQLNSALSPTNPTFAVDTLQGWNTARLAVSISGSTQLAVVRENGTVGSSGTFPSWPNPVTFDVSTVPPDVAVSPDGTKVAVVVKGDQFHGRSVYARVYDATTFSVLTASVTLDSGSAVIASDTAVDSVGATFYGPGSGTFLGAFTSMSASSPANRLLRFGAVDTAALPYRSLGSGNLIRHTDLTTKPFRLGANAYAWGTQVSTAQTTDFLVRHDGNVDAVSRYSEAYQVASASLGRVEVRTDGGPVIARRAVTSRDQFIAVSGGLSSFGDRHPELLTLTYHPSASWKPADVGGALYMPGGYLGKYDGSSVTENGFLMMVEGLSGSVGSSSLGAGLGILLSGSQYGPLGHSGPIASASFVYEVIPVAYDALGNEEQGGCVSLLQVYLTASSTQVMNTASLAWNTIAHTRRNGDDAPDIRFKVFRTGFLNGVPLTTRQRIDDPARPIVNQTGSDSIAFTDTVPTTVQALGEVAYTQLSPTNGPTPGCQFVAGAGDRLYITGLEGRPLDVAPSKLRLGGPVAFADGASFSVDSDGGAITGIGAIDQDIAVFKATRVYHTVADGPDNTLTDTTPYPQPQLVNSDVGAPVPSVIVQSAGADPAFQGLVFRSSRGFRLLQRGTTMVDIGARMRRFDPLHVVAGLSPSETEEVRFLTSEGETLVLNTRYNEWSTFPEQTAVAACSWRGRAAYTDSDGRVRVEASGTWLDGSTPYSLRMATGWLPLQGLQGLSRVRRLLVLGDFHSHHRLRVEMAVDYRDSWRVIKEIDTRTALGVTYYGGPQVDTRSYPTSSLALQSVLGMGGAWDAGYLLDEPTGSVAFPCFASSSVSAGGLLSVSTPPERVAGPLSGTDLAMRIASPSGSQTAVGYRASSASDFDVGPSDDFAWLGVVRFNTTGSALGFSRIFSKSPFLAGQANMSLQFGPGATAMSGGQAVRWTVSDGTTTANADLAVPTGSWGVLGAVLDRSTGAMRCGYATLDSAMLLSDQVAFSATGTSNAGFFQGPGRSALASASLDVAAMYVATSPGCAAGMSADLDAALGRLRDTLAPRQSYGSGSYGGHDPVYQLEFRLPVERFQTCRFRFSDVDQELSGSAEPGRSYSLTEMRLLVATDTARPSLPTRKVR